MDFKTAILNIAITAPPPGTQRQMGRSEPGLRYAYLVCAIVFFAMSTISVAARIYTKLRIVRKMFIEDYLLIAAWIFVLGFFIVDRMIPPKMTAMHMWNIRLRDYITNMRLVFVMEVLMAPCMLFLKTSVILLCLRVFVPAGVRNMTFWIMHALMWANIGLWVGILCIELFTCRPIEKWWNPLISEGRGKCIDFLLTGVVTAAFNAVLDLLIFACAQWSVWSLSLMDKKDKLHFSVLFAVSVLACASAIPRLYWSVVLMRKVDATYTITWQGLWVWAEFGFGFLVACLPTIPRLFRHLRSKLHSQRRSISSGPQTPVSELQQRQQVAPFAERRHSQFTANSQPHKPPKPARLPAFFHVTMSSPRAGRNGNMEASMISIQDAETGRPEWVQRTPH